MTRALLLIPALVLAVDVAGAAAGHPWTPGLLTIDPESAQKLLHAGERLAFVDLRPADAYRAGHLPGARSVPLAELRSRHAEIPRDALVVVYGAASTLEAGAAWRFLRSVGVPRAFVLEGGLAAWRAGGFTIEE